MKYITYGNMNVSVIAAGMMRIARMNETEMEQYIREVLSCGINFFDHADIYGGGHCEELFGNYLKENPQIRDQMYIQSKCGIRNGFFDFSYDHIIGAVEGILTRLHTDHLDSLLLHRPDALMEPEEVNRAFNRLYNEGKVLNFGVSNMNRYQVDLLQSKTDRPILVDQLQMSIVHTPLIDAGFNVNMHNDPSVMRDAGTLEYLREKDMILQVWSPLQIGYFEGSFLGSDNYKELNETLEELAEKYSCEKDAIAYAWLFRYPIKTQVVLGSTGTDHIRSGAKGADIVLEREEWYRLYRSAGNRLP
ncbi:MAG: aldo/keto reductase [Erysipelotrichaceae bacterium]|nr:aldo/keto reductase [Erysipelotrichaceae bacterium]